MFVLEMRQGKRQTYARLVSGRINPLNSSFTLEKELSSFVSIPECAEIASRYLESNPNAPRRIDVCYYLFSAAYQTETSADLITDGMTAFTNHLRSEIPVAVQVAPKNFSWNGYSYIYFPDSP